MSVEVMTTPVTTDAATQSGSASGQIAFRMATIPRFPRRSPWQDATVLVTGGTGWLGRAFVEHALANLPIKAIRVYSRDEHKQHTMRQQWPDTPGARIRYVVGDVRDKDRLMRAMEGVDICIHAAALKRVEGSATHAREILKTNVGGTANVVDAAIDCGVSRTVFVSSDKAAEATNCYGKSKALAEDLAIEGNAHAGSRPVRFSCVRYGNVLGSTGSVLHLWKAAVERGEPIPLTDERMTRFWLTVHQAVRFVVGAVEHMEGGEVFVPQMPMARMVDLAEAAFPGYPRVITSERFGGEKFAETCIGADEARHTVCVRWGDESHYCIVPQQPSWNANYVAPGLNVSPGFTLRSDQGPFSTVDELRILLAESGWK